MKNNVGNYSNSAWATVVFVVGPDLLQTIACLYSFDAFWYAEFN